MCVITQPANRQSEDSLIMTSVAYSFMSMDSKNRHCEDSQSITAVPSATTVTTSHCTRGNYDCNGPQYPKLIKRRSKKISSVYIATTKEKVRVQIVVQFAKVGEIDTLKEQYSADVIVKGKWREPALDGQTHTALEGIDIKKYWSPKLYIENTLGDPKENIRHRVNFNDKGEAFIVEKRVIKGTFMENLELNDFPFDVQDLTVTVASELPSYEVELIEDIDEHHVVNRQSFVDEQEWHLYMHTETEKKELAIDQADATVRRSALSVKCRAARRPGYFVWNIFMVTFLICSLAFTTFSVDKTYPQNRLQLSFTLVLTAVAFKSVVNQSLPRISYLTYMDKYLLISMVMLSTVCAWHGLVTLLNHDKPNADRVEIIILSVLSIVYISYNVGFVVIIHMYPCHKRRTMQQKDKEYKLLQLNWIAYSKSKKTGRSPNEHQQQVLIGTPTHDR